MTWGELKVEAARLGVLDWYTVTCAGERAISLDSGRTECEIVIDDQSEELPESELIAQLKDVRTKLAKARAELKAAGKK